MSGKLVLCATPIGNLGDASPRLAEALQAADIVYAEDTRRSRRLADHLGVQPQMRSFFVGNEGQRGVEIQQRLEAGEVVVLLTDAGTPALADPGYVAVRAAIDAGAEVTVVPGPSAVTAALAVAGLPSERFTFEGFLPRQGAARQERLSAIGTRSETSILFAGRSRVGRDLADIADVDPERQVVVGRELTKAHEEVWRGTAAAAAVQWAEGGKGEFTLVVAGADPPTPDLAESAQRVIAAVSAGATFADAVKTVAEEDGVSRRALYALALDLRS